MDKALLGRVHLFPVRHHSPRSSAVLSAFLDRVRPKAVLIEGPIDATSLIDVLVDDETRPPVAILGYRTDGSPGSSLWPFAAYSPEYVAARWAVAHGAKAAFIDIPIGTSLGAHVHMPDIAREGEEGEEGEETGTGTGTGKGTGAGAGECEPLASGDPTTDLPLPEEPSDGAESIYDACARAGGFRSFEEFWEASFEAPSHDTDSFRAALYAYADLVRAADRGVMHRARDAFMARKVLEHVEQGLAPDEIVVVLGAAHAAAFVAGDVDPALEALLPEPVHSAATLIPFSFPRLAEQLGYGAGNRAPQYYQRAHDAGCSYKRATLEVLVEFTEHLRLRGFMASLADTIEAYRLAVALADLRGKAEPGLDEVREATVATLCRGDATHVEGFLWPSVIGKNVGKVADRIGKNSLQEEFWREVKQRRLPETDSGEPFTLKLNEKVQVETSVFLHRLRVAGVPYAAFKGEMRPPRGSTRAQGEDAGGPDALTRTSEAWEAQWTPSTDVALIERIVLGDTLEQVTARLLEENLSAAENTGGAASVLLEAVVTNTARTVSAALAACDRFAALDDDLPSLAKSTGILSGLASFGSSRTLSSLGDDAIPPLCRKTFDRAVLRVREACTGGDEAVQPAKEALRTIHAVAMAQPLIDHEIWFSAAKELVHSYSVNAGAAGLACGLLYLANVLSDDDVALIVGQRLSNVLEPEQAAGFLEGFFEVNALALVKSRAVVSALDGFLAGIDPSRFCDALPILRRAFAALGPTERRYLLENVLGVRHIGDKARAAQAVLLEKDKEKLKEMSADLSKAMDDLDDLL